MGISDTIWKVNVYADERLVSTLNDDTVCVVKGGGEPQSRACELLVEAHNEIVARMHDNFNRAALQLAKAHSEGSEE